MKRFHLLMIFFTVAFLFNCMAAAQEKTGEDDAPDCPAYVGTLKGEAEYLDPETDEWVALEEKACVYPGDILRTHEESGVGLVMGDGVVVKVNESSDFQLWNEDPDAEVPNEVDVEMGELLAEIEGEEEESPEFQVNTPSGVVAVRGTEFYVMVDEEGKAEIKVLDGMVEVLNELGSVLAEAGMATELLEGKIPIEPFAFDMEEFNEYLDVWTEGLSVEALKKKVKEEVKQDVKKQIMDGLF